MIHESVLDCVGDTPLVRLGRLFPGAQVLAKLELLNPGGSVKDRSARLIVEQGLHNGTIQPDTRLVESSSGNFGIALAMACRVYGLALTVVVDAATTASNLTILRRMGADVDVVTEPDEGGGGYLFGRLARVRELVAAEPKAHWINQYANDLNHRAHERTGREVLAQCSERIDYFVAAVSTTGTIHGVSRALRERHPDLKVIAVDAVGSVVFGGPPGRRLMPGIGSSRVPELLRREEIDEVVHVSDEQAITGCHALLRAEGLLAGGSSGSVVWAVRDLLRRVPPGSRVVTLLADRGERYLDLIYANPATADFDEE